MNKMNKGLLPALVLGALSGTASATGFQLMEQNASGLGNAFAGSAAVAENASTIYYNPAGMTQLKGANVSVGVDYITLKADFKNGNSTGLLAGGLQDNGNWCLPSATRNRNGISNRDAFNIGSGFARLFAAVEQQSAVPDPLPHGRPVAIGPGCASPRSHEILPTVSIDCNRVDVTVNPDCKNKREDFACRIFRP